MTSAARFWRRRRSARFDNAALRELPVDAEPANFVRARVPGACLSRVLPTPLANPRLVVTAREPLALVGIELLSGREDGDDDARPLAELAPFLAGNELFDGSEPAAQCYCGHQFGYFSGQLGDGAAISLGEVVDAEAGERWEMQLKGAGKTPYSRQADGRKVLRSTLREFLASEHMHALGVPTTRAGGVVVSTDAPVLRDMFYSGDAKLEPAAVVLRVARSFLRFGSFEIFKDTDPMTERAGPSAHLPNKKELMCQLLDFTIRHNFPEIWKAHGEGKEDDKERVYTALFAEVTKRTARLVAKWQSIGFCHGVLNTDNLSILGDTLDYGPFGFMEYFDPKHVCNTSDDSGRYRFEAQPEICKWNCSVLADQLELVVKDRSPMDNAILSFDEEYEKEYYALMSAKLGLVHHRDDPEIATETRNLIDTLMDVFARTGADYTCTFRRLMDLRPFSRSSQALVVEELVELSETIGQLKRKLSGSSISDAQFAMVKKLLRESPHQARMYGITQAVVEKMDEERKQLAVLSAMTVVERHQTVRESWGEWLSAYAERLKKESKNGEPDAAYEMHREQVMARANPVYVLRNHVAQKAIELATAGEFDRVAHILELLTHPFDESSDPADREFAKPYDRDAEPICVSCSS